VVKGHKIDIDIGDFLSELLPEVEFKALHVLVHPEVEWTMSLPVLLFHRKSLASKGLKSRTELLLSSKLW